MKQIQIQIQIIQLINFPTYAELVYKMCFELPKQLGKSKEPIQGAEMILNSILNKFNIESNEEDGTYVVVNDRISVLIDYTDGEKEQVAETHEEIKHRLIKLYDEFKVELNSIELKTHDDFADISFDGENWK